MANKMPSHLSVCSLLKYQTQIREWRLWGEVGTLS